MEHIRVSIVNPLIWASFVIFGPWNNISCEYTVPEQQVNWELCTVWTCADSSARQMWKLTEVNLVFYSIKYHKKKKKCFHFLHPLLHLSSADLLWPLCSNILSTCMHCVSQGSFPVVDNSGPCLSIVCWNGYLYSPLEIK